MWNTQAYRKSSLLNLCEVSFVCNSLFPLQPCQKYYTSEVTISFNSYNLILKFITTINGSFFLKYFQFWMISYLVPYVSLLTFFVY